MWSNLKSITSTLERVSQAVAPPADDGEDDDGDYYDEDEDDENYSGAEEEEEEEQEYEEGGYQDGREKQTVSSRSPFGFVGLLTRALDTEQDDYLDSQRDHDDDAYYEDYDNEEEEINYTEEDQLPILSNVETRMDISPGVNQKLLQAPFQTNKPPGSHGKGNDVHEKQDALLGSTGSLGDNHAHLGVHTNDDSLPVAGKPAASVQQPGRLHSSTSGIHVNSEPMTTSKQRRDVKPSHESSPKDLPPLLVVHSPQAYRHASQLVVTSPFVTNEADESPRVPLVREKGSVSPAHPRLSWKAFAVERQTSAGRIHAVHQTIVPTNDNAAHDHSTSTFSMENSSSAIDKARKLPNQLPFVEDNVEKQEKRAFVQDTKNDRPVRMPYHSRDIGEEGQNELGSQVRTSTPDVATRLTVGATDSWNEINNKNTPSAVKDSLNISGDQSTVVDSRIVETPNSSEAASRSRVNNSFPSTETSPPFQIKNESSAPNTKTIPVAEAEPNAVVSEIKNQNKADTIRIKELEEQCSQLLEKLNVLEQHANDNTASNTASGLDAQRIMDLEVHCGQLLKQLEESNMQLREHQIQSKERDRVHDEELLLKFQEKEVRLLEAAAEDHQHELNLVRGEYEGKIAAVQRQLATEQEEHQKQRQKLERILEETNKRFEKVEKESQQAMARSEATMVDNLQRQDRARKIAEDKLSRTLALLDEREEEIKHLKKSIEKLQSTMDKHEEGAQEAEEEMDELHAENENLRRHVEEVETQCLNLRAKIDELQSDSDKLSALKLELQMLKEDRERERAKIQSLTATTSETSAQLEAQRDALAAEVQDLKRQVTAAYADVDIARSDMERVMIANVNLQNALEAFQNERDAELALLEEQKRSGEEATAAAHAAAMRATHEVHDLELKQIAYAKEEEIARIRAEVKKLEDKNEKFRVENIQMRRSLDEAIHRLQATQEDVIDRSIMKNILLDWLVKRDKKERQQILEVMANVLHFTEDEKAKVHLDDGSTVMGKVVHSVAAPLPPAKADLEHLPGENVREKFLNFLLAETDD